MHANCVLLVTAMKIDLKFLERSLDIDFLFLRIITLLITMFSSLALVVWNKIKRGVRLELFVSSSILH